VLLAATAVLYLWDLSASGYGNSFYAAAVQAGTRSWKAFFFGSLDSSNYITVDKPPASLWMMALSGRIFGFSSWSMLVPDALCGVASVGLLYAAVRRVAGPAVGLLAGVAFALTPVAVLMFRFNNPDALLVLLLVLAAYCVTRALEAASWRWMGIAGLVLGFGFLTKMLQAFLVLPAFAVAYLICAPTKVRARIGHVLVGAGGIVLGAGWWVLATILWPASSRPYFGGSGNNSVLGLAFGYNGLGRIFGGDGNGGRRAGGAAAEAAAALGSGSGSAAANAGSAAANAAGGAGAFGGAPTMPGGTAGGSVGGAIGGTAGSAPTMPSGGTGSAFETFTGPGGGARGGGFGGNTGITRMFSDTFGAQISWLLPAALLLLVGGLWATRRAPRTDRTRAALILWGGWTVVSGLVFSYMKGTIHEYYTIALAPGIAGTVAVGGWTLWRTREQVVSRVVLALSGALTGVWSFVLLGRVDWQTWLRYPVLLAGLLGAGLILAWPWLAARLAADRPVDGPLSPARRALVVGTLAVAGFGALGAPAAYALDTASVPHTGSIPLAGPTSSAIGGFGGARNAADGFRGAFPGGFERSGRAGGFGRFGGPGGFGGQGSAGTARDSASAPGSGALPGGGEVPADASAGGNRGFGGMDAQVSSALTKALTTNAGMYRWVAAVGTSQSAASMELATGGLPVMAISGFTGSDDAITLAQFQQYVSAGKIHYYFGTGGGGGPGGGSGLVSQISSWVAAHYTAVTIGGQTGYDLTRPLS
jgi:4-amino-4-deoxy-L-arabinose transferase-like glycosyltransferase